ncbi:hypothetical protein KAI54_04010 [Candidatus Gracilibacteria bacterium]|nr:hypothetical protein [Candidatus Gracilibacteria bacterium]
MIITLDSTHADFTILEFSGKIFKFLHARRDGGSAIVRALAKFKISANSELRVVAGPGNFSAIRTACLIGNTVKFLTKCKLFSREKQEKSFCEVKILQPFYGREPSITFPTLPKRSFAISELKRSKRGKTISSGFSKLPAAHFLFSQV